MEPEQEKKKILYFKVLIYTAIISFVVFFIVLFFIPYIVNNWVINSVGNNDSSLAGSWISFWGSFLGGIVGMFAVLLTTYLLIKSQNENHKEQLDQQRDDVVNSINSSVRLEREKFMVQFNIEKYEKALLLFHKLENKLNLHVDRFNQATGFVSEYFNYKIEPKIIIPSEHFEIYPEMVGEVDKEIRDLMLELSTLERIIKPFNLSEVDKYIFQYLNEVSHDVNLINTTKKVEIMFKNTMNSQLSNIRKEIKSCTENIHLYIKEELEKYKPEKSI
ncbi:hypothetical protein M5J14_23100 [Lysinibacillus sp. OL1_EC]|uniref:hypothetical protein n=1 Tax=Lysinibacillus sp. OL1_EC TaxID=2943493 RepID=UPI002030EB1D|nr:hypothetical protein [Lysinibacillus sp. OL1_EC]MCM0627389.1 hypothetical protein [Lysinibacillus sp. OL1_EC]